MVQTKLVACSAVFESWRNQVPHFSNLFVLSSVNVSKIDKALKNKTKQ